MKGTTIAALMAVAMASGMAAAYAADAPGPDADICGTEEQLHAQADAVMARYGFAYEEPKMTPELEARIDAAFVELEAELEERMSEIGHVSPFSAPSPEQAAAMAEMYAELEAKSDDILREHGFVIETPDLSEQEWASMNAELDAIYAELDAAYDLCYPTPHYEEPDQSQVDEVMARYGFVYEEPELTPELEASIEAAFVQLYDGFEKRFSELEPAALYGVPSPEQAAAMAELHAEFEARSDDILREHGFVIEKPELSEQEAAEMAAELDRLYGNADELTGETLVGDDYVSAAELTGEMLVGDDYVSAGAQSDELMREHALVGDDYEPVGDYEHAGEPVESDGRTYAQTRGSHP